MKRRRRAQPTAGEAEPESTNEKETQGAADRRGGGAGVDQ
jgi:hypothetical protein